MPDPEPLSMTADQIHQVAAGIGKAVIRQMVGREFARFPVPCPVCGDSTDHLEWRETSVPLSGAAATVCPHPAENGHGTGCMCMGYSGPGWRAATRGSMAALYGASEGGLEERFSNPVFTVAPEISEEEAARLKADLEEKFRDPSFVHSQVRIMPPEPLLTPEVARALVRECVTVVKPGEVLAVRVHEERTLHQVQEINKWAAAWTADNAPGVRVVFMPGEEFAVAAPTPDGEPA